jgi:hypothetical protein
MSKQHDADGTRFEQRKHVQVNYKESSDEEDEFQSKIEFKKLSRALTGTKAADKPEVYHARYAWHAECVAALCHRMSKKHACSVSHLLGRVS